MSLGDDLYLTETANGFLLTPSDPGFEAKMALVKTIMREDRDILRALAQQNPMTSKIRIEPHWLDARDPLAVHDRQIAEHVGINGVRDSNLLDSALARPVSQWNYGTDDPAALAAAYAYDVARNHPFADGKKRTAWVLARLFWR